MWTRLNSLDCLSVVVFKTRRDELEVVATNRHRFISTLRAFEGCDFLKS